MVYKSVRGLLATALTALGTHWPTRFDLGYKSYTTGDRAWKRARGSIAKRNRWTGQPHEDKRAMARLEKQTVRKMAKLTRARRASYNV